MRALVSIVAAVGAWLALAAGPAVGAPLHWSAPVTLPGSYGVFSLACPSSALCVAGTSGDLLVSTDPSGGASAWVPSAAPPQRPGFGAAVHGIACPTVSLCVAVSSNAVLTSTNPAGGAHAWRVATLPIPDGWYLDGVACQSVTACVAFALPARGSRGTAAPRGGVVVASSDPGGGAGAWRLARLRDVADYAYCLGQECALATEDGDILTARDPAGAAHAWHSVHEIGAPGRPAFIPALACASVSSCLAPIGGQLRRGEIAGALTSTRPFSWHYTQRFGGAPFAAPSAANCVPGLCAFAASVGSGRHGGYGEVLTTTRLGGRWSVTRYPASETPVVSCASASFCVAGGIDQQIAGCRPGPSCISPPPTGVVIVGKPRR